MNQMKKGTRVPRIRYFKLKTLGEYFFFDNYFALEV